MVEIFKSKGDFYIVYERPTGYSLDDTSHGKMNTEDFYIMFDDLCRYLQEIRSMNNNLYVLPEWVFIHRNTVKIAHYEPFFVNKEAESSDHVYLFKLENQIIKNESNAEEEQSDIVPNDKKRNLVFNLGIISYHMLTGKTHKQF